MQRDSSWTESRKILEDPTAHGTPAPRPGWAPLTRAFCVALAIATLLPPIALAGTKKSDAGRRIATGSKGEQVSICGRAIEIAPVVGVAPVGRSLLPQGRLLRAAPTQPVSVGIIGSPGCLLILESVGGIFIESRWGSGRTGRHRMPRDRNR